MKVLTTIIYFLFTIGLYANNYYFDYLSSRDGLSQNNINHIYQDSKGFLWLSTFDGLNRYDGYNFNIYRPGSANRGLHNNRTNFIIEDEDSVLWISSNDNTIDRFDLNKERFIQNDILTPFLKFEQPVVHIVPNKHTTYITCLNSFIILNHSNNKVKVQKFSNANQKQVNLNGIRFSCLLNDSCSLILNQQHEIIKVNHNSKTAKFSYWKKYNNQNAISLTPHKHGLIAAGALGLYHIDKNKKTHLISSKAGESTVIDNEGHLWYGTRTGLYKYNPSNGEIPFKNEQYIAIEEEGASYIANNITGLYIDKSGFMWVGVEDKGLFKYNPNRKKFQLYNTSDNKGSIVSNNISKIFEDRQHNIWFGTKNAGLSVLPFKNKKQFANGFINHEQKELKSGYVKDIQELNLNGKLQTFFASDNEALNKHVNPRINKELINIKNLYTSHMKYVNAIENDKGYVWFGIKNRGLIRYSISEDKKQRILPNNNLTSLASHVVLDIYCDSKDRIWVATSNGVSLLLPSEKYKPYPSFINFTHDVKNPKSLSNNYTSVIFETSQKQIIIGTLGGGLNIYNEDSINFKRITSLDGLPNDMIKGILEDDEYNLWISTNNGISKINLENFAINNYDMSDGLQNKEFGLNACCKLHDGQMIFGGISGFNVFYPNEISSENTPPKVYLTELQILNKPVRAGDTINNRILIENSINNTKNLELNYTENSFTIAFTGLYFANPSSVKYRYKLIGFDNDWQFTNSEYRLAKYTNIQPGEYTLLINASNPDGIWSDKDKRININITPPFYRSWWAYLIYFTVMVITLVVYRRYYSIRLKIENALEMERFEKNKAMEFSKERSQLFTNISHDFRTPLSLIKLCFDELQNSLSNSSQAIVGDFIAVGNRNINVLLRLINQLMDLLKAEQGKLTLNKSFVDVIAALKDIFESFQIQARNKHIGFSFKADKEQSWLMLDMEKVEKVIYNLLSNAFKYTPEHKTIELAIQHHPKSLEITVRDTGIGIAKDKQQLIFKRFYQAHNIEGNRSISSGIGLSLINELVKLHNGTINFNSEEGKGTCFSVTIPHDGIREQRDDKDMSVMEVQSIRDEEEIKTDLTLNEKAFSQPGKNQKTILIAEDNEDLRKIIANGFKDSHIVIEAENGEVAQSLCKKHGPDLIISDVMMPIKSGLELCQELKGDVETSHIPIILLTAKVLDKNKIEGYEHGADAYVTKPFSFEVLKMQVQAIFKLVERRHLDFQKKEDINVQLSGVSPIDKSFIEKAKNSIDNNMGNHNFSLEDLASDCHVSTSTLIRKFKQLIGATPKSFIKTQRLKKAKILIEQNEKNITEIMKDTGFVDYSHFAKNFKKEFGITPKNYTN